MADDQEIGRRMRERRKELNLTQDEIADKIPIGRTTYTRWESGSRTVSVSDLVRVAKALFVTVGYFLDENPDEARDPNEVTAEPIMDAVYIASSKGVVTPEFAEKIARYIRFEADEEERKRGIDQ